MRGTSLCEVLHRGSPKTGFLVLLSLISGMLISYLACLSPIWHVYLACTIWHAYLACFSSTLQGASTLSSFLHFLYGPQERAEHPSQLLPYPLGGGRLPRVPQLYFSSVLFGGDVLYLQLYFLTSSSTACFSQHPLLWVICVLHLPGSRMGASSSSSRVTGASTSSGSLGTSTTSASGGRSRSQDVLILVKASTSPLGRGAFQLFLCS